MTKIIDLTDRTKEDLIALVAKTSALKEQLKYRFIDCVMPETGPYSRYKYAKTLAFFNAGKKHRLRMFAGANGTGKSFGGALELTYHATGEYPVWWDGKIIDNPKHGWIVCESGGTFKSTLQRTLLGPSLNEEDLGTGLIPKANLGKISGWPSLSGAVNAFEVKHKKGHWVTIEVKTFDQNPQNLRGANLDFVLEDEEPPLITHTECLFRLRGSPTKPPGILMLLYTPENGMTDLTLSFLNDGTFPNNGNGGAVSSDPEKWAISVDATEAPHKTDEERAFELKNCPPHLIEAKIHGRPGMGAGKIYPIKESQVFIEPFKIPDYWPRCFALDFGWQCTAVIWAAQDPHTKTIYVYDEYYQGQESARIHALNIQARGAWIPGICDPSGGGRNHDGELLIDTYKKYGIKLTPGDNAVHAGISRVLDYLQCGKLKFFNTLPNLAKEYRLYRYDTKNPNEPAPDQADHIMDDLRYLLSRFDWVACTEEDTHPTDLPDLPSNSSRDSTTGY